MKQIDPKLLESSRVFLSRAPATLADIRNRVSAGSSGTAKRDLLSALNTVERLFGKPLSSIWATPRVVRELLRSKSAAQLDISAKRYANIRSAIVNAVKTYGEPACAITKRIPLTPAWAALLPRVENKFRRSGLSRLACYCSVIGASPHQVDGDVLRGLHAALEAEDAVKHPRKILKATIAHWNSCRRSVPGWPDFALSSPFHVKPFTLELREFPESFQVDVAQWADRVSNPDPFDPDAPAKPLRPATVKSRITEIRRFASALVHRGELEVAQVTGLHVFFERDRFKSGLRYFLERNGNEPSLHIEGMAGHLRHIAKYYCRVDATLLETIELVCRRLDCGNGLRLSDRNRERLRQFDDPDKVARLLAFPDAERARGARARNPVRAARCMERALAIDILIHSGLRIQNLRTIKLGSNLTKTGEVYYLSFKADQVKNDQDLEFELPDALSKVLDEFISVHRPRLADAENPYLFAGQLNRPRSANAMRCSISETLLKNAGLEMHPHLFRHALAKIVVERDPGAYAAVSRHLGHKSMDTTLRAYLGTETRASARHINRLLNEALRNPKLPKD